MTIAQRSRRVHRFGDHVDTDVILPGQYLSLTDPRRLGPHCMEGLDPGFAARVRPGDVILAGKNFGAGSSREHAAIAIKACGIEAVIASSFARIFYRNAINIALPVFVCPDLVADADPDLDTLVEGEPGRFLCGGRAYEAEPVPATVRAILAAGGLVPYVRGRLAPPGPDDGRGRAVP